MTPNALFVMYFALAVLVGVPSFIAGWVAGGFRDLKRK